MKQVWSAAEFFLGNYEIQRLIFGNFRVPDVDIVFIVFFKNENLTCTCQQYGKTNGLCPIVVAVPEREGLLESFIDTGGYINKILNNAPENSGDKSKQKE